ncbi:MAG TPA: thioredoxin-like domain-containing protein [Pirellulales bacterium]|nr:thioredoxin-like domain-containing protein [Pirellulales bacterium]
MAPSDPATATTPASPASAAPSNPAPDAATASADPAQPRIKSAADVTPAAAADDGDDKLPEGFPFRARIKAPSLEGGVAWLNSSRPIDVHELKGKWVILDFWTYCCVNCMHILPELKKLEHAHPNDLVVIGVHSAKFDAEKDSQHIAEAIQRYEIEHPVVNDANQKIWDNFGVQAWPSLRVIDPEGYLVAGQSAEFNWQDLDRFLKDKSEYYEKRGSFNRQPLNFGSEGNPAKPTPLRFPGKILADGASGRLFIADSNHNRIIVAKLDGTLLDTIGNGGIGNADGEFATAQFNHPQGMALHGNLLYVADTENHLLRKADLDKKTVVTIAGTGKQARSEWPGLDLTAIKNGGAAPERFYGPPLKTGLNSPWALYIHDQTLYIAMAGPHQIWTMPLDESEIGVYAGNGREDIVDGPLAPEPYEQGFASFAQPSGLTSDGKSLIVADSEGSSIRSVPFDPKGEVSTIVGTSKLFNSRLFRFGDVDGKGDDIRLQHCLGVVAHDGLIYVADTYNNKIKVIDPKAETAKTIAGAGEPGATDEPSAFNQPAGLSYAAGKLYVADTNNHLIRTVDLSANNKVSTLAIQGLSPPKPPVMLAANTDKPSFPRAVEVKVPLTTVKAVDGQLHLAIKLKLPAGYKINALAPMRYYPEAVAEKGVVDRSALCKTSKVDPPKAQFEVALPTTASSGEDTIKVSMTYNYCQAGAEGLCKIGSVVFVVPLKLSATADSAAIPLNFEVP